MPCADTVNIFFDFDQSSLREESFTELERLYELLINNINLIIEISGHTDNKGSRSYNKRLSLNRAKSVVNYLIEKGIDKKRLNYKGFGFLLVSAADQNDIDVTLACGIVAVILVLTTQLISDIGYAFLNPRIRFS